MIIDIHTHILPGFDDGAMDLRESLEMARLAAAGGTQILTATPHANQMGRFENYFNSIMRDRFEALREAIKKEQIPLQILLGMEIYCMGKPEVIERKIKEERLIGLNGTDYYLIEFPFDIDSGYMSEVQNMIFDVGRIPLLAHPERYRCVQNRPELLFKWIEEGTSTQVNKGSIFGHFGEGAMNTVKVMYEHDLVTCVSSDAHNQNRRTPWMHDIEKYLSENLGQDYAARVLRINPAHILLNEDVPMHGNWY